MPQAVLALGAATVTVSGCVWYLPALADLRAGADRPVSRRRAAAACLSGWSTIAVAAVLLLVSEGWRTPAAATAAGTAATVVLGVRAAVQRRRERRETARDWAELHQGRPPQRTGPARHTVALLIALGIAAAVAAAILGTAGCAPKGPAGYPG